LLNDTTLLVGLEGLVCQKVELDAEGRAVAHLVTADEQAARCPGCELVSSAPKGNVTTRPRDLPYGGRGVALMWHKRRWRCKNPDCARSSFTESLPVVPARHRLTGRLRQAAGAAVGDRGAPAEQAGRELGLSWPTVMAAARDHAERVLPMPRRYTVRFVTYAAQQRDSLPPAGRAALDDRLRELEEDPRQGAEYKASDDRWSTTFGRWGVILYRSPTRSSQ
jgi:hypothetical protein